VRLINATAFALTLLSVEVSGAASAQIPLSSGFASTAQGPTPAGPVVDRTERAQRVAALIDSGQCEAARRVSLSEGDLFMARKAEMICAQRSHSVATSHAGKG
jgi:hypothetical protein